MTKHIRSQRISAPKSEGRALLLASTAIAIGISLSPLGAVAQTWDGDTDSDYQTGTNWDGDTVPGTTAAISIEDGSPAQPIIIDARTVDTVVVQNNGLLTIDAGGSLTATTSATLVATGTIAGTGTLNTAAYTQTGGQMDGNVSASASQNLNGGTVSGYLSGLGNVTVTGAVDLTGSIESQNVTIVNAGVLTSAGGSGTGQPGSPFGLASAADVVILNGGNLILTSTESVKSLNTGASGNVSLSGSSVDLRLTEGASSVAGVIAGSGGFNVSGGDVTVSGANTYSGDTRLSSGSLTVVTGGTLGDTTAGTAVSGGTLTINTETTQGDVELSGTGTIAGSQTLNTGTYTQSDGLLNSTISASGDQSLTGGTIAGALSGDGAVTVGGSVLLSGTIASDSVSINGAGSLTSTGGGLETTATVTNAGVLTIDTTADTVASVANSGTLAGSAVLNTGTFTQTAGTTNSTISASGAQTLNGGTVAGALSGAGAVTVGGSVLLSGTIASTDVTINGSGTLTNSNGGLADGTELVMETGGNLVLTSSDTIGGLRGDGDVTLSGGTTTLTYNSTIASQSFSGDISGGGNLNLTDGNLSFNGGNHTYTGNTSVTGATLNITAASTLASTDITIGAGGQVNTNGGLADAASVVGTTGSTFYVGGDETIAVLNTAGTVRLDTNQTLTLANGASSISGAIIGQTAVSGGLTVDGGDVTLSGANTYNGGTEVKSGSLTIASGLGLGADTASTTVSGGTLTLNVADTQAGVILTGGTIAGTGILSTDTYDQSGGLLSGTVNASGDQSLTGGTIAGALSGDGAVTVGGSVLLSGTMASDTVSIVSGNLTTDGGGLSDDAVITNAGTLTVTGAETVAGVNGAGGVQLNGGDLNLASGASSISGIVSGANGLNVIGGNVSVSGLNSYQGGTEVSSGSLTVASGSTLGDATGSTTVSGGALNLNGAATQAGVTLSSGSIGGTEALTTTTYDQSGGLLNSTISASGAQNLSGGTVAGALSGAGAVTVSGSVLLSGTIASEDMTISGASTLTSNGGLADGLALTLGSGSALALGASDTIGSLSGETTALLALDTFSLSLSDSVGGNYQGSLTGGAGSELDLTGGGQTTLSGVIDTDGVLRATDGTLVLTNGSNSIANIEVGGGGPNTLGILRIETTGATGGALITTLGSIIDYADAVDDISPILLNSNDTQLRVLTGDATQSGAISQTGGERPIEKIGAGTLVLTSANTYGGGTTVSEGGLTVAATGALGADTASTTVDSGMLSGSILTIDAATTQGNVELSSGLINGSNTLSTTTYTQSGGQMDGNVSATGLQSLNGGTVSGTLSGDGNVTVGGSVLLSGTITSENVTIGGSSAGTLTNSDGGLAAGTDLVIQNNGGLVLTAADTIASLNGGANSAVTLSGSGSNLTLSSGIVYNVSGEGGLNVVTENITLSGENTYAGATTLTGGGDVYLNGTLVVAGLGVPLIEILDSGSQFTTAGGLEDGTIINNNNGGTFQVFQAPETIGKINGNGQIVLRGGNLTLSEGESSISGVISDSNASLTGGMIVNGATADVTFTGANTYTGGTTVTAGGLTVATGGTLGSSLGGTTVNGGTLTIDEATTQGNVELISGLINGSDTLSTTTYTQSAGQMDGNVSATGLQSLNGGTVSGALSGLGDVTVGGSVLLSGTITSENVTIGGSSAGTLTNSAGGLADGTDLVILNNGGLVLQTAEESIGSLNSEAGGNVTLSGSGIDLTITDGGTASVVAGVITGAGGLNVNGGDVTLSGANSYAGGTQLTSGGLTVAGPSGSLGDTAGGTAVSGGTLTISNETTQGAVTLSGSGTIGGAAALETGTYTQSGGQMAGNVSASGLQELSGGTITGALSGMGDVSVTGATAFVTGAGTIASNDITITGSSALSTDGGALSTTAEIQNAGTLTLTGAETIMSANGGGTIDLNGGDLTLADGTSLLSGVISGGNGLTVDGGAVTISGTTNTFTGPTTLADGTLDLTGNVGGNASVTGADAVLNVTGGTVGGSTTNDGGTINIDGGTFTGLVANMNGTLTGTGAVIGDIENRDLMTVATGETLDVMGSVTVTGSNGTFSMNGGEITTTTGLFNTSSSLIELTNATVGGSTTNSARILALGNNTIGDLNNTGGTIDMLNSTTTDVLNTGAITGGGTVLMNVNLDTADTVSGGTSDQIISSGLVSGAFNFEFTPLGNAATYLGGPITVMEVGAGSDYTIAIFSGLPVGGLAVYSLEKNLTTGDAELISETSSGIAGIGANASLVQSLIGSVVNRPSSPFVSGLASEEGCSQGGYFRGTYGKANVTGTSFNGVRSQETELAASYGGVQAGWDFGCNDGRFFDGWDGTFGALIGYNTGSTEQNVVVPSGIGNGTVVTSVTKTDFDQTYVGAYAAFNKDRLTADVQVRMENSKFTLNETIISPYTGLGLNDTKFDAKSFNVTGRVSYRMDVDADAGISFVPTAGFSYSRTGASSLDFDGGERLEMAAFNSFVGFAGGTLAKTTINEAGDAGTTLFVGGNYYHDFAGDRDSLFKYDVNDESTWQNITTDSIGGFGEISLGVNYVKILDNGPGGAKQLNANIRADGRVGKNISNAASITGQIRLSF